MLSLCTLGTFVANKAEKLPHPSWQTTLCKWRNSWGKQTWEGAGGREVPAISRTQPYYKWISELSNRSIWYKNHLLYKYWEPFIIIFQSQSLSQLAHISVKWLFKGNTILNILPMAIIMMKNFIKWKNIFSTRIFFCKTC